jgi:hypothetical protein
VNKVPAVVKAPNIRRCAVNADLLCWPYARHSSIQLSQLPPCELILSMSQPLGGILSVPSQDARHRNMTEGRTRIGKCRVGSATASHRPPTSPRPRTGSTNNYVRVSSMLSKCKLLTFLFIKCLQGTDAVLYTGSSLCDRQPDRRCCDHLHTRREKPVPLRFGSCGNGYRTGLRYHSRRNWGETVVSVPATSSKVQEGLP